MQLQTTGTSDKASTGYFPFDLICFNASFYMCYNASYYNAGTKPLTRYVMKPGQNQMVGRPTSEHPILLYSNPTKCKTAISSSNEAGNLITLVFPAYLPSDRCCSKVELSVLGKPTTCSYDNLKKPPTFLCVIKQLKFFNL